MEAICEAFEWDLPAEYNVAREICENPRRKRRGGAVFDANSGATPRGDGDVTEYSFTDIDEAASSLASWLERRGVDRRDRVAIALPQHPATLVSHLACYKLAAVAVLVPC